MFRPTRRVALLAALALPGSALAREPAPARPRPQPRRERVDTRPQPDDGAYLGGGLVVEAPPRAAPRGELAPMPHIGVEAPRVAQGPEPELQFSPGFIDPRLPGRGVNRQRQSDVNPLDYRLFNPAPGAHIRMPMTW